MSGLITACFDGLKSMCGGDNNNQNNVHPVQNVNKDIMIGIVQEREVAKFIFDLKTQMDDINKDLDL
jgi:hypothetical protein